MIRGALTIAAVAMLAGCVRVTPPPPLATPIPAQFETNAGDGDALTLSRWWRLFDDRQLDGLIDGALAESPDVHVVEARVREADATMSRALRRYDPQGGINASAGAKTVRRVEGDINVPNLPLDVPVVQIGTTSVYNGGFDISWELDVFGRRNATAVVARSRLYSAQLQAAAARASLAATVADGLFAARGLAGELAQARAGLTTERSLADLVERRVARGLLPRAERLRSATRLRAATAQADALATELDAARRQLLVLVGRGTAPLADLPIAPTLGDAPAVPATTPGDLLKRRPDVVAARSAVAAALGNRALAKLDLFPTFSLSPGIGLEKQVRPANNFITGFWSLGLGLAMPILDRGRLMAELHASDARVAQAIGDYEKSVQTAYAEADIVLVRLIADHRQIARLAASERDAHAYYETMRTGEAAGVLDPDTALAARQQWQSAAIDLLRSRVLVLRRSVQAFKALGGGWDGASACSTGRGCRS